MPETRDTTPASETPETAASREAAEPRPAGAPGDAVDTVAVIADGLTRLSRAELQELDRIVTPRAAELFAKAFGPEIRELLGPLAGSDAAAPESGARGESRPAADGAPAGGDAPDDEAALRALMRDPRYWRDKDPAVMDRVARGFARLYPG